MEPPAEPSPPAPASSPAPAPVVPAPDARAVPTALVAALGLYVVSNFVIGVAWAHMDRGNDFSREAITRWSLLDTGFDFAFLALALAGALDLRRRTSGRARTGATVILGAAGALFALALVSLYMQHVYFPSHHGDSGRDIWIWTARARSASWLAIAAGLIVAGWHVAIVRTLAAPLVIAMMVAAPFDFIGEHVYKLFGTGRYNAVIGNGLLDVLAYGLAIAVLWKSAPAAEASGGWARAGAALDRTAASLYARLWIAVSGALLVLMLFGTRGEGGEGIAKLWAVGVPLANAIAGLVMVSGILGAAGLTAPRAPRARLYGAGAAMMVTVAISSVQVFYLVRAMLGDRDSFDSSDVADVVQALPVALPAIALIGMVLLAAGLHGLAAAIGSAQLAAQATSATGIVITCQLLAIGIPYGMSKSESLTPGTAVMGMLAVAACAVIALVSLARLCRALATGLRARHELPTATLLPRAP